MATGSVQPDPSWFVHKIAGDLFFKYAFTFQLLRFESLSEWHFLRYATSSEKCVLRLFTAVYVSAAISCHFPATAAVSTEES